MSDEPDTLVGLSACGCIRFARVDEPGDEKAMAESVAKAIRAGLRIERRATASLRENPWRCDEHKGKP